MRKHAFLLTLALALLAPALAAQESEPPESGAQQAGAQTLMPGDVVRLRIWREPTMSGEFPVDEAGMVIFPRVGEYMVLDDTDATLQARLLTDYQQYLRNPSIEIRVLRRVGITGEVNEPGLHLVDPTITVRDALALAGGATPRGAPNKIRIIRDGIELTLDVRQDTRLSDSAIRSGDQLYVPERGWFSRNTGVVASLIAATASLAWALFR